MSKTQRRKELEDAMYQVLSQEKPKAKPEAQTAQSVKTAAQTAQPVKPVTKPETDNPFKMGWVLERWYAFEGLRVGTDKKEKGRVDLERLSELMKSRFYYMETEPIYVWTDENGEFVRDLNEAELHSLNKEITGFDRPKKILK